jgi:hypothetical protein
MGWGSVPRSDLTHTFMGRRFDNDSSDHGGSHVAHALLYTSAMKKALLLSLLIPAACTVGPGGVAPITGTDAGSDLGSNTGSGSGDPTHITSNTTWTSTMAINGPLTIDAGVTVTIAAGTVVSFGTNGALSILGTLDAQGAKGNTVKLQPAGSAMYFNAIDVQGTLKLTYVVMTGGWVSAESTATTTITDSQFSHASHDLLVTNGGTISIMYSQVGIDPAMTGDTTHCDLHFGGTAPVFKASHSNFNTSAFGVMFYGGQNADFTYDNWQMNTQHLDPTAGVVTGDFSFSYFTGTTPTAIAGLTIGNVSATALPACNGTNDATCAGPRL